MAAIEPVEQSWNGDGRLWLWEGLVEGDTCLPLNINERQVEVGVDVYGTFGGSTIAITGSLDQTQFSAINDSWGNAMSFTSVSGIIPIGPKINGVKPTIAAGSGADVDILIYILNQR